MSRAQNAWNRLVSTSYGMLRIVDYQELVLRYLVTGRNAEMFAEHLRSGA